MSDTGLSYSDRVFSVVCRDADVFRGTSGDFSRKPTSATLPMP
ncbi:hypothetical protein QUF80_18400 [Desulfococcaceae bacterium HSG8]|nr:hypothetical protein [Desulfococcaceae bacterium HSG8]